MKKQYFYQLSLILFLSILSSCSFFVKVPKDSELITDFSPLEWNDDYVFGATLYPPRITVWDSQSKKVVRHYDFFKAASEEAFFNNEGRWICPQSMLVVGKTIWCIAKANQCSLVKIDVETGKCEFIDLEKNYDYLEYIPEANNGKGGILVVPQAQYYKQNISIKLFGLNGKLLFTYKISDTDTNILSAAGQTKNGCYYFCTATDKDKGPGEPNNDVYKIVKLNLLNGKNEIIPIETEKLLGKDFVKNTMPSIYNKTYLSSLSIKKSNCSNDKIMVAVDFIDNQVGRFLFETDDLSLGQFTYSGKNIIVPKETLPLFPRMYFKNDNQYSMIGNDGDDLYAIFYNDSKNDICYMPRGDVIYIEEKDDAVWCAKNTYKYSNISKKWVYDDEGIYKVDLKQKTVTLYLSDGSSKEIDKDVFDF
ncbi:MAG: hypothetical protein MJ188_07525 [Treponema sp.]|nr:hypothetical protein [Treponema sp.]